MSNEINLQKALDAIGLSNETPSRHTHNIVHQIFLYADSEGIELLKEQCASLIERLRELDGDSPGAKVDK